MKKLIVAALCAVLAACGGGGSAEEDSEPNPQATVTAYAETYCQNQGGLIGVQQQPPGTQDSGPLMVLLIGCKNGSRSHIQFDARSGLIAHLPQ